MRIKMIRLSIALLGLLAISVYAHTEEYLVVGISDGDTVTVIKKQSDHVENFKVRLAYIDAPEFSAEKGEINTLKIGQPFGKASKKTLSNLIYNKNVSLKIVGVDRYGRKIAVILDGDKNVNLEMVKSGYAWVYRKYAKHQINYYLAEEKAKQNKLGLWQEKRPIPPWEYRRSNRK